VVPGDGLVSMGIYEDEFPEIEREGEGQYHGVCGIVCGGVHVWRRSQRGHVPCSN
jgi:hypothetical protein